MLRILRRALIAAALCSKPAHAETFDVRELPRVTVPEAREPTRPPELREGERARGFDLENYDSHALLGPGCYELGDPRGTGTRVWELRPGLIVYRQPAGYRGPVDTVVAIREQLEIRGRAATLLVDRAWISADRLRSRPLDGFTIPMKRLLAGPESVQVFGAWDGESVHFVVSRRPRPQHGKWDSTEAYDLIFPLLGHHRFWTLLDDSFSGVSTCDHTRVRLTPGSDGASVTVSVPLYFDGATGAFVDPSTKTPLRRRRVLAVHLGASKTRTDPRPIVSAVMGWIGPSHDPLDY